MYCNMERNEEAKAGKDSKNWWSLHSYGTGTSAEASVRAWNSEDSPWYSITASWGNSAKWLLALLHWGVGGGGVGGIWCVSWIMRKAGLDLGMLLRGLFWRLWRKKFPRADTIVTDFSKLFVVTLTRHLCPMLFEDFSPPPPNPPPQKRKSSNSCFFIGASTKMQFFL